jgi:hypothetical protein
VPREWATPVRADWCPLIHQSLQAIDRHNQLWFASRDPFHLQQAQVLREYVGSYIETLMPVHGEVYYRSCVGGTCRYSSDLWQAELYLDHLLGR